MIKCSQEYAIERWEYRKQCKVGVKKSEDTKQLLRLRARNHLIPHSTTETCLLFTHNAVHVPRFVYSATQVIHLRILHINETYQIQPRRVAPLWANFMPS